jgi:hypothetical protein
MCKNKGRTVQLAQRKWGSSPQRRRVVAEAEAENGGQLFVGEILQEYLHHAAVGQPFTSFTLSYRQAPSKNNLSPGRKRFSLESACTVLAAALHAVR